ncbi:MAG: PadR family transcriptional regulator [Actinomycetota bacterium]
MAVRDALLALLAAGPRHGYQLRSEFDAATGGAWPLNVGQVYTTLQRLERDGFVEPVPEPDDDGRTPYRLTDAGHRDVAAWFDRPAEHSMAPRDELPMKVLMAAATDTVSVTELVGNERRVAMATLQDLTALKQRPDADLARRLQIDRMVLRTEAEIRWLDLVEERLAVADPPALSRRVSARVEPNPSKEVRS